MTGVAVFVGAKPQQIHVNRDSFYPLLVNFLILEFISSIVAFLLTWRGLKPQLRMFELLGMIVDFLLKTFEIKFELLSAIPLQDIVYPQADHRIKGEHYSKNKGFQTLETHQSELNSIVAPRP